MNKKKNYVKKNYVRLNKKQKKKLFFLLKTDIPKPCLLRRFCVFLVNTFTIEHYWRERIRSHFVRFLNIFQTFNEEGNE